MNLNMIAAKNQTEDLLLSITKNCETLNKQTHRKAEETLEFELTKPRERFHFQPPISIEGSSMIGLTNLEVYKSIFNNSKSTNLFSKFQLYTDTFDEFSFTELKDKLEEILDITSEHLQDDIIGPRIISTYKKLETEKRQTDAYYMLLMGYARSSFRDFESYLRIVVGLDEDVILLILKQYNSNFVTYELSPGIYSIKDISEVVYTMGDHEGTLQIEYDDIRMKTKPILTRFGGTFGTLRFDERSFFNTFLGFTPYWDYRHNNGIHVDSPGLYTSCKISNLSTIDKIHSKCDVIDGSVVNGLRQRILFSFISDKPSGY